MFYEIFFGIVAGVVFSTVVVVGLNFVLYRLTGGKARHEEMQRRHDEQRERIEKRLKERDL